MISINRDDGIIINYMYVDTVECAMCSKEIDYYRIGPNYGVPWYMGPVKEGFPEAGGKTVCKPCFDKWVAWNNGSEQTK